MYCPQTVGCWQAPITKHLAQTLALRICTAQAFNGGPTGSASACHINGRYSGVPKPYSYIHADTSTHFFCNDWNTHLAAYIFDGTQNAFPIYISAVLQNFLQRIEVQDQGIS